SSERTTIDLQQADYEELDQMNAAKPYAKASYRINRPEDIGIGLARAIRAAVSGRPGGVYLDLPANVLAATMDAEEGAKSLVKVVDAAPRQIPDAASVTRALSLLAGAQRPLIVLGKGAAYAQADADIRAFIEKTEIPFLPMSMSKGLLPDDHALSAASARSLVLQEADVVMLVGARLNWLLGHGKSPQWSATAQFVQLDILPTEMDSNRPVAAPVVGDIASSIAALLAGLAQTPVPRRAAWLDTLAGHKDKNAKHMAVRLAARPDPMDFYSALGAIRGVLAGKNDVYLVNEGANTLDITRNVIDMHAPRLRLDTGTWGVMGVGMGYAVAAAVTSGKPVVAIEGDSAFGFSGMELETICRYKLPIVVVVFNNGGIYRGDGVNLSGGSDPSPTVLMKSARYELVCEAFGGAGYHAADPDSLAKALTEALASGKPALINVAIDPKAGTESGHIGNLNPHSAVTAGGG
ncbi:MAG TPA: oxalyl-CoA decarboxylase, partial [Rhizomicrobium sp.]